MGKFYRHTDHLYTVENQNGFKNALYDFFGATDDGKDFTTSKQEVKKMVQNYPEIYPCSIVIINQSFECSRVYVEVFDLKEHAHYDLGFTH